VAAPALRYVGTIPLPGVAGRLGHLAADADNQHLFVAALGNGSVELLNLRTASRLRSTRGFKEPHGVIYLPSLRRAVVADGGGHVLTVEDGASSRADTIADLDDGGNVRFDPGAGRVYVGFGRGGLAVFDPARSRRLADIKLPGRPEAFALEGSGPSLYVNLPAKNAIAIVDRLKGAVVSTITLKSAGGNYPMALDEAAHRLFVATRKPARVVVLDTRDGSVTASFGCVGDADDLFYDAQRERIYVSGGEGFVDVFDGSLAGRNLRLAHVATGPGARTSLWVPELRRLFVAVPARAGADPAVQIFEAPEAQ
jgi:DNA-binding beta-propeller fold protein YncE